MTPIRHITKFAAAALIAIGSAAIPAHAAVYIGTDTYTGYSGQATPDNESPFFAIFGAISQQDPNPVTEATSVYDFRGLAASVAAGETYFFLEDVQDGQLDSPGVTYTGPIARTGDGVNGSNNGGSNTDNVAEDTLRRSSFRTTANQSGEGSGYIRVDFNAAELGGLLPTYAGIVFAERTTGNNLSTDLGAGRLVRAYDADDNLLEEAFADGTDADNADGFVGVSTSTGIAYVTIAGDNEYDHFQYGNFVPEPASLALLSIGGLLIAGRQRRA